MKQSLKHFFLSMLIICVAIACTLVSGTIESYAADTDAPKIDITTLKVSKSTVSLNDTVKVSVKVTDASEITDVTFHYENSVEWWYSYASYNKSTGLYEAEIPAKYFGKLQLRWIEATDIYSNNSGYDNIKNPYDHNPILKYVDADLSAGDINVSTKIGTKTYTNDNKTPVIDYSSITVSNKTPKLKSNVTISFKVTDSAPIASVRIAMATVNNFICYDCTYNSTTKKYEVQVPAAAYGDNNLIQIYACDAFQNANWYVDTKCTHYKKYSDSGDVFPDSIPSGWTGGHFTVNGGSSSTTKPTIDFSSIRHVNRVSPLNVTHTAHFKTKGNDIDQIEFFYAAKSEGGSVSTHATLAQLGDNGEFILYTAPTSYGHFEVVNITLKDVYGNETIYTDPNVSYAADVTPFEGTNTDLSKFDFFVGMFDKKSGIFVCNSDFDISSKLKVEELEEKGANFKKLLEKNYECDDFFEIKVSNTKTNIRENSYVFFKAPDNYKDGDIVRVRHLQSDGSIQTEDCVVDYGLIYLRVSQFSPFMVETPSTVSVSGQKYKLTSKGTAVYLGPKSKNTKTVTIPATVKIRKKTVKVTSISSNAFKGCKKLTKVTVGKNVKYIGKKAFYGCNKLKTIKISSTKLTTNTVGASAFSKINKSAIVKVPSKKVSAYKKLLKKKGLTKKSQKVTK